MTIHDYIFVFVPVDCKQNLPEILDLIDITFMTFFEDYHQQYLHKNPWGYCGLKGTGVTCPMPPKK